MATRPHRLPTATEVTPTWHVLSPETRRARSLDVDAERGLTSDGGGSAPDERYGPNKFAEAKTEPRWHAFLRQYRDPMQIVLVAAGHELRHPASSRHGDRDPAA